jgi:hypothetical protein
MQVVEFRYFLLFTTGPLLPTDDEHVFPLFSWTFGLSTHTLIGRVHMGIIYVYTN